MVQLDRGRPVQWTESLNSEGLALLGYRGEAG
jgi:hypothetical protein